MNNRRRRVAKHGRAVAMYWRIFRGYSRFNWNRFRALERLTDLGETDHPLLPVHRGLRGLRGFGQWS